MSVDTLLLPLPLLLSLCVPAAAPATAVGSGGRHQRVAFSPPVLVQRGPGMPSDSFFSADPKGLGRALFVMGSPPMQSFDSGHSWSKINNVWPHGIQFGGSYGPGGSAGEPFMTRDGGFRTYGATRLCAGATASDQNRWRQQQQEACAFKPAGATETCGTSAPAGRCVEDIDPLTAMTSSPVTGMFLYNATGSASGGPNIETYTTCDAVSFHGLPYELNQTFGMCDSFTSPSQLALPDGSTLVTFPLIWANEPTPIPTPHSRPMSLVAFRSVDGGRNFDFLAVMVNHTAMRWSAYGPNEHSLALLADNKTLMAVFRPDTDGMCPGGPEPYRFYYQTYSTDVGKTWSTPSPINNVGCVRPRMLRLSSGPVLLTGGRLCPNLIVDSGASSEVIDCWPKNRTRGTGGIFLWVNHDGMAAAPGHSPPGGANGTEWEAHCLSSIHNFGWKGDPTLLFSADTNSETYNSVVPLGHNSAAVFYSTQLSAAPWTVIATFMMHVTVDS